MRIGVLGATGPAGGGLAVRLVDVGHTVVLGSRDASRAEAAVAEWRDRWGDRIAGLKGAANAAAAAEELVILAVPWDAAAKTAADHADLFAGKVVVCMANGLERQGREFHAILPEGDSVTAAVQAATPDARVVAAFQHVPAAAFGALDEPLRSDVLVAGDDDGARSTVLELIDTMPELRGFDTGTLTQAMPIEAFAALLLSVNVRYKGKGKSYLQLGGIEPEHRR